MVSTLTMTLLALGTALSGLALVVLCVFDHRKVTVGEYLDETPENSLKAMVRETAVISPFIVFIVFLTYTVVALLFNAGVPLNPYNSGEIDIAGLFSR